MESYRRIYIQPKFIPKVTETGMICSEADVEPAHFKLVVKRFSSKSLENPNSYIMTPMAPVMIDAIRRNYPAHVAQNVAGINQINGAAEGKTMIICGAGRSLVNVLSQIPPKDSVDHNDLIVVAINGALKALDKKQVDMFFVLDWSGKPEWVSGYDMSEIVCIFGLTVPAHFIQSCPKRLYFASNLFGLDAKLCKEWEAKIGQLEASKCATYSLMHLAYNMGCGKVIFVGHDFAVTDGWYYWDQRLSFDFATAQQMVLAQDMFGATTITGPIMMRNCNVVMTSSMFCGLDGMACLNASEAGIMAIEDYTMPLADALAWGKSKEKPVSLTNGHENIALPDFVVKDRPVPV